MRDKVVIREKCAFKTAKRPLIPKKKKGETIERIQLEREVQNLKELIMLWWPHLWNPPLDHADLWIYCSYHTPILTDRRDLKAHNPFDRNHIGNFLENKKKYTCKAVLIAG